MIQLQQAQITAQLQLVVLEYKQVQQKQHVMKLSLTNSYPADFLLVGADYAAGFVAVKHPAHRYFVFQWLRLVASSCSNLACIAKSSSTLFFTIGATTGGAITTGLDKTGVVNEGV